MREKIDPNKKYRTAYGDMVIIEQKVTISSLNADNGDIVRYVGTVVNDDDINKTFYEIEWDNYGLCTNHNYFTYTNSYFDLRAIIDEFEILDLTNRFKYNKIVFYFGISISINKGIKYITTDSDGKIKLWSSKPRFVYPAWVCENTDFCVAVGIANFKGDVKDSLVEVVDA